MASIFIRQILPVNYDGIGGSFISVTTALLITTATAKTKKSRFNDGY